MSKIKMTVKQIKDLGLWDKICDYKGWNPYCLSEGLIDYDEIVEFDSEFKAIKKIKITIGMGDSEEDFIIDVEENLSDEEINDIVNEFYRDKIFELTGVTWEYKCI